MARNIVYFLAVSLLTTVGVSGKEPFVTIIKEGSRWQCETRRTDEGDFLGIGYVARYTDDGEVFDESIIHDDPPYFKLGEGKTLPIWEDALWDMCTGEIREITMSADDIEAERLPPGAKAPDRTRGEVSYTIELLKIMDNPPMFNAFMEIDEDNNGRITRDELKVFYRRMFRESGSLNAEAGLLADEFFEMTDKDGNDVVTFKEFIGRKYDEL